jgi:hypothetical protein
MDQIRMCGVKKQHIFLIVYTTILLGVSCPVQDLRDLNSMYEVVNKATRQL